MSVHHVMVLYIGKSQMGGTPIPVEGVTRAWPFRRSVHRHITEASFTEWSVRHTSYQEKNIPVVSTHSEAPHTAQRVLNDWRWLTWLQE